MTKNICIITAGGTIGMVKDSKTGSLVPAENPLQFLDNFPDIKKIANIDLIPVLNIDSSNMQPADWTLIANKIHDNYKYFDGFVVIQGTDTMAYTASAFSYIFQNLNKPIVFTGSLLPAFELGSDAINNLIYACQTATQDIAEVCLVFSNKILRGNRAKKFHESFLAGFHSPNFPELGELGRPIILQDWRFKTRTLAKKLDFKPLFESKVGLLKLYPGISPEVLDYYLNNNYKGLLIEAFGSGNIPFLVNSIADKINQLSEKGVLVAITTQMEHSKTNLNAYQAGVMALKAGAVSAHDMTTEAAMTKLMWLLANHDQKKAAKLFYKNLVGEISN